MPDGTRRSGQCWGASACAIVVMRLDRTGAPIETSLEIWTAAGGDGRVLWAPFLQPERRTVIVGLASAPGVEAGKAVEN
jgi:hypothetical protein